MIHIQIQPLSLLNPNFPLGNIGGLLAKAIENPTVSLATLAATTIKGDEKLAAATAAITAPKTELAELVQLYTAAKLKIEPERMGAKILAEAVHGNNPVIMQQSSVPFTNAGLNWQTSLQKFISLKGNTSYEELFCVGADYHNEALVATLRIKKPAGYSGNLCSNGSKEYVGFCIQEQPGCQWVYAGTAFVNAHDTPIPGDGLSYSVILPHSFVKYRKPCSTPVLLKVRGFYPGMWRLPRSIPAKCLTGEYHRFPHPHHARQSMGWQKPSNNYPRRCFRG